MFHAYKTQHGAEPVDVVDEEDEEDAPDVGDVADVADVVGGDVCHACACVCHVPGAPS